MLNGKTVKQALQSCFTDGKGRVRQYKLADLRYDAKKGFINVNADVDAAIARLAANPRAAQDYDYGWEGDTALRFFSEEDATSMCSLQRQGG